jgi:hypothetical protein
MSKTVAEKAQDESGRTAEEINRAEVAKQGRAHQQATRDKAPVRKSPHELAEEEARTHKIAQENSAKAGDNRDREDGAK